MRYLVEYEINNVREYYVVDQADDIDHAIEQVQDAYPGATIIHVYVCEEVF